MQALVVAYGMAGLASQSANPNHGNSDPSKNFIHGTGWPVCLRKLIQQYCSQSG